MSSEREPDSATAASSLPPDLYKHRVLSERQAAEFWGVSQSTWRRLWRGGRVPSPIPLSDRRNGWEVAALLEAGASRAA